MQYNTQCQSIVDQAVSEKNTNAKNFATQIKDISVKIIIIVADYQNCSHVIKKAQEQEIEIGCPVLATSGREVSHDPSERPPNMNSDECKFLINLGPCQPKLKSFPEK